MMSTPSRTRICESAETTITFPGSLGENWNTKHNILETTNCNILKQGEGEGEEEGGSEL